MELPDHKITPQPTNPLWAAEGESTRARHTEPRMWAQEDLSPMTKTRCLPSFPQICTSRAPSIKERLVSRWSRGAGGELGTGDFPLLDKEACTF